jgi:four helix bundle protein
MRLICDGGGFPHEKLSRSDGLGEGAGAYSGPFIEARPIFRNRREIRRCSASIAANIAEGCGKQSNAEFQRFLHIAAGSASELEYHFLLSRDLGLLSTDEHLNLDQSAVEVKRMLAGLIKKVDADRRAA